MADSSKRYFWYQSAIFVSMYLGYILYVLARKSFTFAMPAVIKEEGLNKDSLGLIVSSQTLAYSISKFVGGVLVDRFSPKALFSTGLALSGILTIVFTTSDTVLVYTVLWFLVGLAQGCGWPSCAKLLRQWWSQGQFGTWWSILSTSMNVAGSVGPLLTAAIIVNYDWKTALRVPGCISIVWALVCLFTLHNDPSTLGLQTANGAVPTKDKGDKSKMKVSWRDIITCPFVQVISLNYLIIYIVRTAALDWGQLYLIEEKDQSQYMGSGFISSMETGGIIGSVIAGSLGDWAVVRHQKRDSSNPRMKVCVLFCVLVALCLHQLIFTVHGESSEWLITALGFGLGFGMYGPVAIIGVMAIESAPPHISGTCHALVALAANIGAVLAGLPLSIVAKHFDWSGAFLLLEILMVFTACLFFLMRNMDGRVVTSKTKAQ